MTLACSKLWTDTTLDPTNTSWGWEELIQKQLDMMSWVSWAQTSYLSAKNHQLGQLSQCHTSNYYFCPIFWFLKKPGCFYPNHNGILQNIFFSKILWMGQLSHCHTLDTFVTFLRPKVPLLGQMSHHWVRISLSHQ